VRVTFFNVLPGNKDAHALPELTLLFLGELADAVKAFEMENYPHEALVSGKQ